MTQDQDPKTVISRMFEAVMNQGQLNKVDEYFVQDFVEHAVTGDIRGREAFKQFVAEWRQGFPDIHSEVLDIVSEGALVYWTVRFTGTNTGEFNGMPATGRPVDVTVINKGILQNGRGVEHWTGNDAMQLMQQLGLMPQLQGSPN